jgi:hypothetical protein
MVKSLASDMTVIHVEKDRLWPKQAMYQKHVQQMGCHTKEPI